MRLSHVGSALLCWCAFSVACDPTGGGDDSKDSGDTGRGDAPPVGSMNFVGSAHVTVGLSFEGTETHTVLGEDGALLCQEDYTLTGDPTLECDDCTWAFHTVATDQETLDGDWCAELAIGVNEWLYPTRIGLGFLAELSQMAWQSGRYDWDVVPDASASWSGDDAEGDLSWNWNYADRSYYGYE